MKIVFISSFLTHHQTPLINELNAIEGVECLFVETQSMPEHRKQLGYTHERQDHVVHISQMQPDINEVIRGCDVLISGGVYTPYIRQANRYHKTVFVFSERLFKDQRYSFKNLLRALKYRRYAPLLKQAYLLCAGGFVYADYRSLGLFRSRAFSWGYFPAFREYRIDKLMGSKNKSEILWCARFLTLKHYDDALEAAYRLKNSGLDFTLSMIGIGEMLTDAERIAGKYRLGDHVRFLGAMPTDRVREHMERAGIFIFTSDRHEGWGAVLNEAMNSGCAVVTSDAVGAATALVRHDENGMVYPSRDVAALSLSLQKLLEQPAEQRRLGENAYRTIAGQWNPKNAANRFVQLARAIKDDPSSDLFENGVCSKAEVIRDKH